MGMVKIWWLCDVEMEVCDVDIMFDSCIYIIRPC